MFIQAVDALLEHGANPSLKLNKGVGSALCAATSFAAERRRSPHGRIRLVSQALFGPGKCNQGVEAVKAWVLDFKKGLNVLA